MEIVLIKHYNTISFLEGFVVFIAAEVPWKIFKKLQKSHKQTKMLPRICKKYT